MSYNSRERSQGVCMARITHYEIEGELLTFDEIVARTSVKPATIRRRLQAGNRTWVNLSRSAADAIKLARQPLARIMDTSSKVALARKRKL